MAGKQLFLLLALIVSISTFTVNNPIIWADVPDIDMIRVDDTYYMVSTTMFYTPGAPIQRFSLMGNMQLCI